MRFVFSVMLLLRAGWVNPLFADNEFAPSGMSHAPENTAQVLEDLTVRAIEISDNPEPAPSVWKQDLPIPAEKDTTKKEEEPKPEPMVLGGAAAVAAGTGLAVAGAFGAPGLLLVAALCFAGGALLTALGWKKIKAEPKKYSGEKIAIVNYIVIGVIGVLASFYSLYILFTV